MGQTEPHFLPDLMSDRKKSFRQLCVIFTKKQHGARPCVEKMQLIFFVPPNEELEGTLHPKNLDVPPKNEGKGYMYPQMKKPVGMLITYFGVIALFSSILILSSYISKTITI
jgi:hypothetical protein